MTESDVQTQRNYNDKKLDTAALNTWRSQHTKLNDDFDFNSAVKKD